MLNCSKYKYDNDNINKLKVDTININSKKNLLNINMFIENVSNDTLLVCNSTKASYDRTNNYTDSNIDFYIKVDPLNKTLNILRMPYKPPDGWHFDGIYNSYFKILPNQLKEYNLSINFPIYDHSKLYKLNYFNKIKIIVHFFPEVDKIYQQYLYNYNNDIIGIDNNKLFNNNLKGDSLIIRIIK